jgi:hypothetical protein
MNLFNELCFNANLSHRIAAAGCVSLCAWGGGGMLVKKI